MGIEQFTSATNDSADIIESGLPYRVEVEITGAADILFHRWSDDAVAAKAAASKGSKAKKTDDIESYVYRLSNGNLALPGEYIRQSVILTAKFKQDPRSPRKRAYDLFNSAIISLTPMADLGVSTWDYLHKFPAVVPRNSITLGRPAIVEGWKASAIFMVNLPEYVSPTFLLDVLVSAGRFTGVGDFRPTYGRFQVTGYTVLGD